jgi:hypothetical protein
MVVMVWLPSCGLFCGRLAGVMFCAFLGVLEVPVLAGLMLLSKVLESVNNNPYLGVELSSTLSWDTHIGNILTKVFGIHTAKFRQMSHKYQATSQD